MTDLTRLHETIAALAPIDGVSIGRKDDPSTWKIQFRPEATKGQKDAAAAALAAFDINNEAADAAHAESKLPDPTGKDPSAVKLLAALDAGTASPEDVQRAVAYLLRR